jgi:NAD(P)-dependent dehydrogenase (short-subunit alcohol dehydrogenase family)
VRNSFLNCRVNHSCFHKRGGIAEIPGAVHSTSVFRLRWPEHSRRMPAISKTACELPNAAVSNFSRLDMLVNAGAAIAPASVMDMTMAQWDEVMNIGLRGVFFYCQAATRKMIEKGAGRRIINIISPEAFDISPTWSTTALPKTGSSW